MYRALARPYAHAVAGNFSASGDVVGVPSPKALAASQWSPPASDSRAAPAEEIASLHRSTGLQERSLRLIEAGNHYYDQRAPFLSYMVLLFSLSLNATGVDVQILCVAEPPVRVREEVS